MRGQTRSLVGETEEQIADAVGLTAAQLFGGRKAAGVPIIGRVLASDGKVVLAETGQHAPASPLGTSPSLALLVLGHEMRTFADHDALIYFEAERGTPREELIGYPCVVETDKGDLLMRRLLRGSKPDHYDLESLSGAVMRDQRLAWAAELTAVIPPRQAGRAIRHMSE